MYQGVVGALISVGSEMVVLGDNLMMGRPDRPYQLVLFKTDLMPWTLRVK